MLHYNLLTTIIDKKNHKLVTFIFNLTQMQYSILCFSADAITVKINTWKE